MKKLLCTAVLTSMLFHCLPALIGAEETPEKGPKKTSGLPFRGKISAIDLQTKKVSLAGKQVRTYQVTTETKIKKDGEPATLDDAKVGDSVGGYAVREDEGAPRVVTLNITTNEPPPEK